MHNHSAVRVLAAPLLVALALLLATMQTPVAHGMASTYKVDNINDSGAATSCADAVANDCSLRQAITKANTNGDAEQDTIDFSLIGSAGNIQTIVFITAPPPITQPLRIDGITSPAGKVELTGVNPTGSSLVIQSSTVVIKNLALNRFVGDGLTVDGTTLGAIDDVTIQANRIGVDKSGITDQGNGGDGVEIKGAVTNLGVFSNVIGNNNGYGIRFTNVTTGPNFVQSNFLGIFIGTPPTWVSAGNSLGGIWGTGPVTIGGEGSNRNFIGSNTGNGVTVSGAGAIVENNSIGMTGTPQSVRPNTQSGVLVSSGSDVEVVANIILGNGAHGVRVNNATNVVILGNFIGVSSDGTVTSPNALDGVHIMGTSAHVDVGTTFSGGSNVISGNGQSGIEVEVATATDVDIAGNYIGTNEDGDAVLPNGADGITATGSALLITGNVISGNQQTGLRLTNADHASVTKNIIGTNDSGTAALPNLHGIRLEGTTSDTTIGDIGGLFGDPLNRNIISGNEETGVFIGPDAEGTTLGANYIGVDIQADDALPNTAGVWVEGPGTSISGNGAGEGNVVSGNTEVGILVTGADAIGAFIYLNMVGTDLTGLEPIPNGAGIIFQQGAGAADILSNIIAFNGDVGLRIVDAPGSPSLQSEISGNSIHDNAGLGIDLGVDGPTANDANDADTGANNLQNFPVIKYAHNSPDADPDSIGWELDSTANTEFDIRLFRNAECDSSGFGEGADEIRTFLVTTNSSGHAEGVRTVDLDSGDVITATAARILAPSLEETSEFSACETAIAEPPATPTPTPATATPTPAAATPTPTVTATPVGTPAGTPTATVTPLATATGSPVATATATIAVTPTGTPSDTLRQGDVTCDGDIDDDDMLFLLEYIADLIDGLQEAPCPDAGEPEPISGFEWGDLNCDGAIDGIDALFALLFTADLDTPEPAAECLPVGETLA